MAKQYTYSEIKLAMDYATRPNRSVSEHEYKKLAKDMSMINGNPRTYKGVKSLVSHIRTVLGGEYLNNKRLYGLIKAVMNEKQNRYEESETVVGNESNELLAMQEIKRSLLRSVNGVSSEVRGLYGLLAIITLAMVILIAAIVFM